MDDLILHTYALLLGSLGHKLTLILSYIPYSMEKSRRSISVYPHQQFGTRWKAMGHRSSGVNNNSDLVDFGVAGER